MYLGNPSTIWRRSWRWRIIRHGVTSPRQLSTICMIPWYKFWSTGHDFSLSQIQWPVGNIVINEVYILKSVSSFLIFCKILCLLQLRGWCGWRWSGSKEWSRSLNTPGTHSFSCWHRSSNSNDGCQDGNNNKVNNPLSWQWTRTKRLNLVPLS